MDKLDPQRLRVEGIAKLLHGLDPTDEAGLILFDDAANGVRIAVPLAAVTDATTDAILREAGAAAGNGSPDLSDVLGAALSMAPGGSEQVISTVVLVTSARLKDGGDVEQAKDALRASAAAYAQAGVGLHVISLGPFSDHAQALASILRLRTSRSVVDTGNALPVAFAKALGQVQGHSQSPHVARLDPESETQSKTMLDEIVLVAPYTELLQIDLVSNADAAGIVPFAVGLMDPSGEVVQPTFAGHGNAFFRILWPMHGHWRYQVILDRKGKLTHQVITDNGLKIIHYCPSVVERGKDIDLHFGVLAPRGPVEFDTFAIRGVTYEFAGAEVTLVDPDDVSDTVVAELEGRRSPYTGEHVVTGWRGEKIGAYAVGIAIYVRRKGDAQGDLFVLRNPMPITIQVVDDRNRLPMVSLALAHPQPTDASPIPLLDTRDRPPQLVLEVEAREISVGMPSPYAVGRSVIARVEQGEGWELVGKDGSTRLTGQIELVGRSPLFLDPDTTAANQVIYTFPSAATQYSDKIYLEQPGYYRVQVVEGPTYRVDPERASVIRHVGKLSALRFLGRKYEPPPDLLPLPPLQLLAPAADVK